ncbi:hypothetical protein OQA88_11483 [Cercophora sp. LCS_1]
MASRHFKSSPHQHRTSSTIALLGNLKMKLFNILLLTLLSGVQASPLPSTDLALTPVPESSLDPRQAISRTIYISSTMHIHDDETFGDDDFTRTTTLSPVVLGSAAGVGFTRQVSYSASAGGEIRVEVLLTLTLRPSDLGVQVNYVVKLFEGTSESTNDLDGQIQGSQIVGKDKVVDIKARVRNTDEGGDWADLTLNVTMWLLDTTTYQLRFELEPSKYAILSHTWEDEEVSFEDIKDLERAAKKTG